MKPEEKEDDESYVMLHWYCFTYFGYDIEGNQNATGCTYTGYVKKDKLTLAKITKNKGNAHMGSCTLLGVSYLGYMTKEEFTKED